MLQPFEEAAFVIFTRSISSKARATEEKKVFNALLRVAIIFGSTAVRVTCYAFYWRRIDVFTCLGFHGTSFLLVGAQVRH